MFADRRVTPKLPEIKKLYQNVDFKAIDAEKGIVEIKINSCLQTLIIICFAGDSAQTRAC